MTVKIKKIILVITAILMTAPAFATNGYFTHCNGAKSQALAGAGSARPASAIDLSSNPASALLVGDRLEVGSSLFSPRRSYSTTTSQANRNGEAFTIGPNAISSAREGFVIPPGFTPFSALIGGALIGLAAVLLMRLNGRTAGVSGITHGALANSVPEQLWRLLFIAGLVLGGLLFQTVTDQPLMTRTDFPAGKLLVAGLLVGAGTRIGSGCTSGHGVCGIARLSTRSIAATAVFLAVGVLTATLIHAFWRLI